MDPDEELSVGFGPQERGQVVRAAAERGVTLAEFVHDAALNAAADPFAKALANTLRVPHASDLSQGSRPVSHYDTTSSGSVTL
ncbi:hypothetical protein [Streptomyces morookaense]|uniref:DUF1778 domain-containing protein n=1 Tax=Streptomyces morookaense TaxID=1970 RepID=A0A7Y7E8I2_STRMO|nr:hypothetical protein [Streptomyces morookaense]NVK80070.1 hypothetical protein [Streptomyces morookaense]GHF46128.1 hypothetical protein GCM10010359_55740 [Streptomyces morookaense]